MTDDLSALLDQIPECDHCGLMAANEEADIPFVPIVPKPDAKMVFIGRDPSPRTAREVGRRGGRSVFINEIYRMVDLAAVADEAVYITDLFHQSYSKIRRSACVWLLTLWPLVPWV